ncbi:MAG: alanine:cation symporter family protein, partial [Lentihominibacter sp.]
MNTFLTTFNDILTVCNDFLYSKFLIIVLIGAGIYFTVRSKFVQIRLLPEACRVVTEKSHTEGGMSSFQALMIATASRVGTGNIAGIATAIVAGGPGALFWMWIMCITGGASAFVES